MVARVNGLVRGSLGASAFVEEEFDATKLALIAKDSNGHAPRYEEAWARLIPIIAHVARIVGRRLGVRNHEYVDEAPQFIFTKIGLFDPTRGSFEGWCARVLARRFIDLYRHFRRDALGRATTGSVAPDGTVDLGLDAMPDVGIENEDRRAALIDLRSPFGATDLESIRKWEAADRLTVVVVFGLWRKISTDEWTGWVREVGPEEEFSLAHLEQAIDLQDRIWVLARFLNREYNTVYQRAKRKAKALLPQLGFAREFYGVG